MYIDPKWAIPAAVGVVSFGVGAAVGYMATKRQYDKIEEDLEEIQSDQLQLDFNTSNLDGTVNRLEYVTRAARQEADRLVEVVREIAIVKDIPVESKHAHPSNHKTNPRPDPRNIVVEGREPEEDPDEKPEGSVVHIFAKPEEDTGWDYEVECAQRKPGLPYVIHRDEFFNDEMGYSEMGNQRCFTWYAGDEILVDESDVPIYNVADKVGELKFGHGSGDENIVYIRNEAEEEEYEIVHDDGSYEVNVLGGQLETEMEQEDLRHMQRPGKFRDD